MIENYDYQNKVLMSNFEENIEETFRLKFEEKFDKINSEVHKLRVIVKKTKAENIYYKEQNDQCMAHLESMRQKHKEVQPKIMSQDFDEISLGSSQRSIDDDALLEKLLQHNKSATMHKRGESSETPISVKSMNKIQAYLN